ncbi:MAG TPA: alpha/beta hydrolase [Candidatus Enterosoma merdigallinarum]|nr:alpha/beta hydrolase [Candidatus Enterosoma merdigallinarum]
MNKNIVLEQNWDKTFKLDENVNHEKVVFHNRFGIDLVGDLYLPKNIKDDKLPAIAVCGPFGAVKEQASGLYAMEMAKRGFITFAFDPSFTGESGGNPRYNASPDINTEDFQAAVDFLSTYKKADPDRIGILGICGWGGLALNTASIDTRVKATIVSTMYDMSRIAAKGYFDQNDSEVERHKIRDTYSNLRTKIYGSGDYGRVGGCLPLPVSDDVPFYVKDYSEYYKGRAYHPRSLNSTDGWNLIGTMSFLNAPILQYTNEIRSAVLIIHGEKAHSCYMGKEAYENMMKGNPNPENKELLIIPGAVHTDLYDNLDVIPFDKIESFLGTHLK